MFIKPEPLTQSYNCCQSTMSSSSSPVHTEVVDYAPAMVSSSAVPKLQAPPVAQRKRRRRTAATGAHEDCFTCRRRQVKCDRRRPYCSQCLEIGKDCSGYRTTLTWGVGVASRGKLRGLSLPIANSEKAAPANDDDDIPSKPLPVKQLPSPVGTPEQPKIIKLERTSPYSVSPRPAHAGFLSDAFPASSPIPIPASKFQSQSYTTPGFAESLHKYNGFSAKPSRIHVRPRPLGRNATTGSVSSFGSISYDDPIFSAPSTATHSTFSESSGFPSPCELPKTPEEIPLNEPAIGPFGETLQYADFMPVSMGTPCQSAFDMPSPFLVADFGMVGPNSGFASSVDPHIPRLACNPSYTPIATPPPPMHTTMPSPAPTPIPYQSQVFSATGDLGDVFFFDGFDTPVGTAGLGHSRTHSFDFEHQMAYPMQTMPTFAVPAPPVLMRQNSLPDTRCLQWPVQPMHSSQHMHRASFCQ